MILAWNVYLLKFIDRRSVKFAGGSDNYAIITCDNIDAK